MKIKQLILILIAFNMACISYTCQECQHICDENCIYDGDNTCDYECLPEIDSHNIWWPDN